MEFADHPTVSVDLEIAADTGSLWKLVTDVDLPARFSDEFLGGEWLDEAGPGLGSRFRGRNHNGRGQTWETVSTVVAFEPLRSFGWAVNDVDNPAATWRFDLDPVGSSTRLSMTAQMGPGPSGMTTAIAARPNKEEQLVKRRLDQWRSNMERTLAGIKQLAES